MGEARWSDQIDPLVEQARFAPGEGDWWQAAEAVVNRPLPDEELRLLATVGLAELVTQAHRLDRDREYRCMGDELLRERFPEVFKALE